VVGKEIKDENSLKITKITKQNRSGHNKGIANVAVLKLNESLPQMR
jgi:hypothetical protein